jgi:hypothetical protein
MAAAAAGIDQPPATAAKIKTAPHTEFLTLPPSFVGTIEQLTKRAVGDVQKVGKLPGREAIEALSDVVTRRTCGTTSLVTEVMVPSDVWT